MIVVHVIGPEGTETPRHEFHYPDGTADAAILADMRTPDDRGRVKADMIGKVLVRGVNPETGKPAIVETGDWVIDHPKTVIAIGELYWEKGHKQFRELRRLQMEPVK